MVTQNWISERIKKTIDQYFWTCRNITNKKFLETSRLYFIGGVLQTALHLLPTDKYNEIARWCYETHGYDPGGQADGRERFKKLMTIPNSYIRTRKFIHK